ncbi:MAG: hypothetical protein ABI977_16540 [Acidobacteriota bacterium]
MRFDLPAIQRLGDGRCPQCGTVCCFCCMANHRLAHPEPAREITDHRSEHTRRIGKFTVSPQVIFDMPEALRRMFGHMIVIRCEQLFHKHGFEYIAICDAFEVIDIGEEPRLYEPTFDGTTWTFPRVDLLGRRIGNTKVDQCL